MSNLYGVIRISDNKVVSTYDGDRIAYTYPYSDRTLYHHFLVAPGNYPGGYSLDGQGNLVYDSSYVPPQQPYQKYKFEDLVNRSDKIKDFILEFAAENSEILSTEIARKGAVFVADPADPDGLNPADQVALATFIRSKLDPLVDDIEPLWKDLEMYHFWRIEAHFASITREDLLASESRLTELQTKLITICRG